MLKIADLQDHLREGKAIRRPRYPVGRFVWDRGDGLLVMVGPQGGIQAKPFLLDDTLADDWTLVDVPMVLESRSIFTMRAPLHPPQTILATLLGVDRLVPLRDFPALFVSGVLIVVLVWLLTFFGMP